MASPKPAVEASPPPRHLVRLANAVLRPLLRSRFHRLASKNLMLLVVTGRKSRREYVIPVGRHELDGELVVSAMGRWRENLCGGAPVELWLDGRSRLGYAELEEDPDEVARGYKAQLDRLGRKPRDLGLKVNLDRSPSVEELKPALAGRRLVRIQLT